MTTTAEILAILEEKGSEATRNMLRNHGARDPFFGVKTQDIKQLQRKIKVQHDLALSLYATGNSDAMYLAGMIVDVAKLTPDLLNEWVAAAYWYLLSETTIPEIASQTSFGKQLAMEWIDSDIETTAAAGWATCSHLLVSRADTFTETELSQLIKRVEQQILTTPPNRVRYTMNGFLLSVGTYVVAWRDEIKKIATKLGKIEVNMGKTACKVPYIPEYIAKIEARQKT